jgi:hypothetical protein
MQSESDRQTEIEAAEKQYPDLEVCWDDAVPGWYRFCTAEWKDAPRAEDLFKAMADGVAIEFRLCATEHPEPWRVLLESLREHMRQRNWEGYSVENPICPPGPAVAELSAYSSRFVDGKSPNASELEQIRKLVKATIPENEARRMRAAYELGKITNVFSALADYRRLLAVSTSGKRTETPERREPAVDTKREVPKSDAAEEKAARALIGNQPPEPRALKSRRQPTIQMKYMAVLYGHLRRAGVLKENGLPRLDGDALKTVGGALDHVKFSFPEAWSTEGWDEPTWSNGALYDNRDAFEALLDSGSRRHLEHRKKYPELVELESQVCSAEPNRRN